MIADEVDSDKNSKNKMINPTHQPAQNVVIQQDNNIAAEQDENIVIQSHEAIMHGNNFTPKKLIYTLHLALTEENAKLRNKIRKDDETRAKWQEVVKAKNEELKVAKIETEQVKELVHIEEEKVRWYKNQVARKDTVVCFIHFYFYKI